MLQAAGGKVEVFRPQTSMLQPILLDMSKCQFFLINLELLQQRSPKPADEKNHQKGRYCDEKQDCFLASRTC